ncbi:MAG: M24 family metallopeptidase, partial [Acidobacteriota bacterium]
MLLTPKEEIYHRIIRLQKELNSANVDGFLISQNVNLFYFSGTMQNSVMFVPREGEPLLLVKRSLTRAQIESPLANIVPYTRLAELPHTLSTLLEKPLTKLYLELDVLPAWLYLRLKELFSETELANGSEPVRKLRMIKSRFEIEQMQKAADIARAVYSEIPSLIQPGMREIDLSAELEAKFRKMGHQGLVRAHRWDLELYYGAVISGANMSYPVPFEGPDGGMGLSAAVPQGAGEKPIQEGEPI